MWCDECVVCKKKMKIYKKINKKNQKKNQGGLKHRKVQKKSVQAYRTYSILTGVLWNFTKNISKCPGSDNCDAFYLRPLSKPNEDVWYAAQPLGRHKLATVVSTLCKDGGLHGYRTNHSLRTSAATRLYQAGVDEQLITEVTGHRSNAVRNYKRTSTAQKRTIREVIEGSSDGNNNSRPPRIQ